MINAVQSKLRQTKYMIFTDNILLCISCIFMVLFAGNTQFLCTCGPLDKSHPLYATNRKTKLVEAIQHGNIELANALLDRKKNINGLNSFHSTALMAAVQNNCIDIAKRLIEMQKGFKKQDKNGYTALMYAVLCGHTDIVKLLVKEEAGLKDNDGCTALGHAVSKEHKNKDIIKLLIPYEAHIYSPYSMPYISAAECKKIEGYMDVVELLKQYAE